MKIIANRADLISILSRAGLVATKAGGNEMLRRVLLTAADNKLRVNASNCEQSVSIDTVTVQIEAEGSAAVDAEAIREIISAEDCDVVTMIAEKDRMKILTDSGSYVISCYPASGFPLAGPAEADTEILVSATEFSRMLRQTIFAVGVSTDRFAFGSIGICTKQGKGSQAGELVAVASDGNMMGVATSTATISDVGITGQERRVAGGGRSALLPEAAARICLKLIEDGDLRIEVGSHAVAVHGDGWSLRTNLVEGALFPYASILRSEHTTSGESDREALASTFRRGSVLAESTKEIGVHVAATFGSKGLKVEARGQSAGQESVVSLPCKVTGDELRIGFNPRKVIQGLSAATTDVVRFGLNGNSQALVISSGNYTFMAVPQALRW